MILGIISSFLILGFTNYLVKISDVPDFKLQEFIGNSLFQLSHILLFTGCFICNPGGKFSKVLLLPILVQLVDIVPIDYLYSLKFSLISTLSVIVGWGIILIQTYQEIPKKINLGVLLMIISMVISSIPGLTTLTSLSEPNGSLFRFGIWVFGTDYFSISSSFGNFDQTFSLLIYSVLFIKFVIEKFNDTFFDTTT